MDERGSQDHLLVMNNTPGSYSSRSPIGEYDQIVCDTCEQKFGPWDQYGIELLRRINDGEGTPIKDLAVTVPVDYTVLKLFIMSMLWRAKKSSRPMFTRVSIGGRWNDALTAALNQNDPREAEIFSVSVARFRENEEQRVTFDPHRERISGVNFTRFYVYGGYTFIIKVDQRPTIDSFTEVMLRPDRDLCVLLRNWSPSERRVVQSIMADNRQ